MQMDAYSMESSPLSAEQKLRIDLAACYRLIALYGWDDCVQARKVLYKDVAHC